MSTTPDYRVPALERGLDIIEALAVAAIPQSLTDLATRLDRSASTLFRMLNCLERRHYVSRDPLSGKYALSLKLFALAHTHSPVEALLRAARQPMQDLVEEVRESCHLSLLDRGELLVIAQSDSPEPVRLSIEVGARFDPVLTLSGRLLLAQLEPEARLRGLERSPSASGWSVRRRNDFLAELDTLRGIRTPTVEDESFAGVEDLAVVLGDPAMGLQAALAISRFRRAGKRPGVAALHRRLRETAAAISTQIGLLP